VRITNKGLENGSDGAHDSLAFEKVVREAGYVYIYLSNDGETEREVYFDDFSVKHVKSPVVQSQDYYPFGLTHHSYARENVPTNKYLYNQGLGDHKFETERISDLNLNTDQSRYRSYDYMIGRWLQLDPKGDAGSQESWSSYQFAFDNPIRYNDPKGDCPPRVPCTNPLADMQIRENRASNLGPGYVRTSTDGTPKRHDGHDLYAPTGTSVRSTMAGRVVSAANAGDYGNTIVVKTNTHPEAQASFVGPKMLGYFPEQNTYTQYSHLASMNVQAGTQVSMGQNIGTTGTTGNASGMAGTDEHLHIQVGSQMSTSNMSIANTSVVSPNLVYHNVSFESADVNAIQNATGVIKIVTNNGSSTRVYQAPQQ